MEEFKNMSGTNGSDNATTYAVDFDWYQYLLSQMCTTRDSYTTRMVIYAIFISFGIVGNVSLLIVILKDKHLRNSPNILICNLALADLMYIVIVGPIRIEHEIHPCWLLGRSACALKNYAPVVCQCACVYSLVALSRERYSAIVSGIQTHMSKQVKMTVGWTLITWIFGLIFASPILSKQFSYVIMNISCMTAKQASLHAKIYETCKMFILYVIPVTIISIHYIIMAKALIRSTKSFKENTSSQFIKQINARKRLAYLSITLSIFFGLFWLPSYVYTLMYHFSSTDAFKGEVTVDSIVKFRHFHYYMSLANSSLNPWLVFIMSSSHRNRLRSCITCGKVAKVISSFRNRAESTAMYAMSTTTGATRLSVGTPQETEKL